MASIDAVRQALKTRLDGISGLNAYADWPGSFNVPGAIVLPVAPDATDRTLGNSSLTEYGFEIVMAVGMAGPLEESQRQLDDYTSPSGSKSIRAAIVGDRTLGGSAISTFFAAWDRPSDESINGVNYLAQHLTMRVWTE